MMIKLKTENGSAFFCGPYNTCFNSDAKKLGGKWDAARQRWAFDSRDEQRVRDLCFRIFGSDGVTTDFATIRIVWRRSQSRTCAAISEFGRPIATAKSRDGGAKLGDGVVLLSGGFGSGGSWVNWVTTVDAETVVLVRDFPRAEAERLVSEQKEDDARAYSIEREAEVTDLAPLRAERDRLIARLAEVESMIAMSAATATGALSE